MLVLDRAELLVTRINLVPELLSSIESKILSGNRMIYNWSVMIVLTIYDLSLNVKSFSGKPGTRPVRSWSAPVRGRIV